MNDVATRWFAVGSVAGSDPEAGRRALEEALLHDNVKLLIVFCSGSHDLQARLREIRARSGGVPLIGCTTAGEIATSGAGDAGTVVAALGGDGFAIDTAVATDAARDLRGAGTRAARCLRVDEDRPHRVLLLLTDGLAGNQQDVVRGAYAVLGAEVPLVGGCAGDGLRMTQTFQLYGDPS